ncbi:MAG: hypothetical protein R3B06_20925 [Kofleriaceae bacterium]
MRSAALVAAALVAGCTDAVDAPPLGDYTSWYRVDVAVPAPGHGDTYRIIYVNDVARTSGTTERDAVLVKEIRDDDGGSPGALRYVAIMRKLVAGPAPEDEGGWLFSRSATPGGAEVHSELCWNRCHAAAPLAGVWLDYPRLPD